jgi:hypothetical protein
VESLLVGVPKGKRPLVRPRRRRVDNIKMDLGVIEWDGMDWIGLDEDREKGRALCECGNEPSGSIKCKIFLERLQN